MTQQRGIDERPGQPQTQDPFLRSELARLRAKLTELEGLLVKLRGDAAEREISYRLLRAARDERVRVLEERLAASETELRETLAVYVLAQTELQEWKSLFERVVHSRSYRMTEPLRRVWLFARGEKGTRRRIREVAGSALASRMRDVARRVLPARVKNWIRYLRQGPAFVLESNLGQKVRIYTTRHEFYAGFPDRILLDVNQEPLLQQPVSLIATVKNEGTTINRWLESIRLQTRRPDEIVITDGGSTDDTMQKIQDFESRCKLGIRLISAPGANVAAGRNMAIRQASHEIIAVTDGGCEVDPNWLRVLTIPFSSHPGTEVVAGFYEAQGQSAFERIVARFTVPRVPDSDPRTFSPSSRSLAFRRPLWQAVGGYPECLTLAGEDTLFNVKAKARASEWAVVPDALVYWQVPRTFKKLFKTFYAYGFGDGEAQLFTPAYVKLGIAYAASLILLSLALSASLIFWPVSLLLFVGFVPWWVVLRQYGVWHGIPEGWHNRLRAAIVLSIIHLGQVLGYYRGQRNRPLVRRRKLGGVTKNFLMLAGIPMYDTGGGQRSTQLTLELLRRGLKVTYVNRFPSYETEPVNIRYVDPLLECVSFEKFNLPEYFREHNSILDQTYTIVEFPLPEYLELVKALRHRGVRIIYDLLDDWSSPLGGSWYSRKVEDDLIASSDLLAATALDLKEDLERRASGRPVILLPNAVDSELFNPAQTYTRPPDLPSSRPILGYIGSMYGEWFREDLVAKVARAYPQASVVLIGDQRQRFANRPRNLYTLGLKPHHQMPAYLAHFDVCLIPFDPINLIQATSPLKVFEYVTMGKSVVATKMRELEDIPGVYISQNDEEFVANVARALHSRPDLGHLKGFVERNSWKARIDALLAAIEGAVDEGAPSRPTADRSVARKHERSRA